MEANEEKPDLVTIMASSIHDMKNSVCILVDGLERMLGNPVLEGLEERRDVVHMVYETKRINSNLMLMLTLYKVGNHMYPFDPQPQSIEDFLSAIAAQNKPLLDNRNIELALECDDNLFGNFDEDLVAGVIGHAVNNAIHYTRDKIRLAIQQVDGWLEIRVEDNGTGYPPRMIQEGVDAMRGVDFSSGSTGLGLYFSAVVAKMHRHRGIQGEIFLENGGAYGGGCFVLRLP
ncbi:MAG TPA: HAMP domain-containing sensor histidine kinase [Rhodocyclaceae bacterium]|nr:HAMP domain-containing sensor histidine kinase [Rhodocyclaceae bacterium]